MVEDVLRWLMTGTRQERYLDRIFAELCGRLLAAGVPLARASLHFRTHHPQWLGARILWHPGVAAAVIETVGYAVEATAEFLNSPFRTIINGADEIRQKLDDSIDAATPAFPLFGDLRREGLTEYIAWPLDHTLGKRHLVTFSTAAAGGFADTDVELLSSLMPALALVSEIRLKSQLARTLLETYVGPYASEKILEGATTRGSGVTVDAAVMICDLRNFTSLSDHKPRDEVIALLNRYFDALCEPIEGKGGEILKFMGDGLLAIFPLSRASACADLLLAIEAGRAAIAVLNDALAAAGEATIAHGIGVHAGQVMYGNIGSRNRLDFTVIGPAVNIASRLESLTKTVGRDVLFSRTFAEMAGPDAALESIGTFALRGLEQPVDVFGLRTGVHSSP